VSYFVILVVRDDGKDDYRRCHVGGKEHVLREFVLGWLFLEHGVILDQSETVLIGRNRIVEH
jgi:hypothetical protein